MDQYAVFLAGTILISLSFLVIISTIVLANNICNKYWKKVTFFKFTEINDTRFMTDEEATRISPTLDSKK